MATAEARYETVQERLNATLEGFRKDQEKMRGDLTSAQETLRTEMTKRDAEASKREVRHLLAVITAIGVAVAFLAFQDDRQNSTDRTAPVPAVQNPVAPANQ